MRQFQKFIQAKFIQNLRKGATRELAAIEAGLESYVTVWNWMQKDEKFAGHVVKAERCAKDNRINKMIYASYDALDVGVAATEEDLKVAVDTAKFILERHDGWIKPNPPQPITGVAGQPIETKDVTPMMSDHEAARRICLLLSRGMMDEDEKG